jgi:hypothetical protein
MNTFDVYVTVHRRHSERCDKVCLNMFRVPICYGHIGARNMLLALSLSHTTPNKVTRQEKQVDFNLVEG